MTIFCSNFFAKSILKYSYIFEKVRKKGFKKPYIKAKKIKT